MCPAKFSWTNLGFIQFENTIQDPLNGEKVSEGHRVCYNPLRTSLRILFYRKSYMEPKPNSISGLELLIINNEAN